MLTLIQATTVPRLQQVRLAVASDCCTTFGSGEISEWVDEDPSGEGQTALCPKCGIDSVIGDKSGADISPEFLRIMHAYWF
jgi:hypothetical protein